VKIMCPHCGQVFASSAPLIPTHDWPKPCRQVCPGSGQIPRNPETDRRPLWKDLPKEANGSVLAKEVLGDLAKEIHEHRVRLGIPPSPETEAEAIQAVALGLGTMPDVEFTLDPLTAWILLGNLQLACLHPGNVGQSAKAAVDFARRLQELFAGHNPELGRQAEKGFHAVFDVPQGDAAITLAAALVHRRPYDDDPRLDTLLVDAAYMIRRQRDELARRHKQDREFKSI
jgi:hypothetical protein